MRVGAQLSQVGDFSATLTQEYFTTALKFLPTSPKRRAGRKDPSSIDETEMRQYASGDLRWVAAVSRQDICARLAKIPSRIDSLCGNDVQRMGDLARAAKERRKARKRRPLTGGGIYVLRTRLRATCAKGGRSCIAERCQRREGREQTMAISRLKGNTG